ncbi:ribonuclease M5 [Alkaliphilus serpentinus]|uniref:Ribonuclease M5 n=1 Tax=Alkaliphilus serpentinus TaxID=1482731 RepID=A0A833MAC3_9FIRM|nr:ribonuclease M5 [Alkaliphilus serpentinus]KAB3531825.1 ribonuclease M5 [Alkaliphilus serpentinus]
MIKEIIVVEGKDDVSAIKRAVDAEMIITGGYALPPSVLKRIETAAKKRGVIIFTDPDYAGERIRHIISSQIPGCKHAFLSKEEAMKDDDIGVENASPENIIKALEKVRCQQIETSNLFTKEDLIKHKLIGYEGSADRRNTLGQLLGIGYGNGKQFLSRLNNYGVTREEFLAVINTMEE